MCYPTRGLSRTLPEMCRRTSLFPNGAGGGADLTISCYEPQVPSPEFASSPFSKRVENTVRQIATAESGQPNVKYDTGAFQRAADSQRSKRLYSQ